MPGESAFLELQPLPHDAEMTDGLFKPAELGSLHLKNRIVYPAMTRGRCPGGVVGKENVKYYTQRAGAGMVVTEPSAVCEGARGFCDAPELFTLEHARAWSEVTKELLYS